MVRFSERLVQIMNNVHYNVNGLLNTQRKTQLKNVLEDIQGVQKVNVDLGRGSVEVNYNDATNEQAIRQGIERVGCKIQ
jgi:copper chaperone